MVPYPETLSDQTVRMVVRTSVGGPRFRLEFSNAAGGPAVTFGAVHAALRGKESAIVTGTDRVVTFGGRRDLTLFPGAKAVSDPIDMPVPALAEVAVSIYLPQSTPVNTVHSLGLNPAYIAAGNVAGADQLDAPQLARSYFWLAGVSVATSRRDGGTIVAFGDSITDGYATTPGAHASWPDLLAARLQANPRTRGWSVVNTGISGNRILKAGAGDAAVARFDEDVLARPGVRWVLLLEGINDINMSIIPGVPDSEDVTADQIIAGLEQIVERAHLHGIKVAGGTIMATKGLPFYSAEGEAMRQAINRWIRTSGRFDAVIDFDAATRDPADPLRLRPDFDPGDHVHPNDAANRAMADAIDLGMFK
ncbi:SGNH/GDSL hydrolase family protein [Sphingomonas sp.]|uniref:SGNH/GDSL hydrolase family protein n=1 Tax=Sphingomonas sp. TaxID=28214 RepID=UPI001B19654B|nr:SGNH/GDSL hydrolase family protein [Sphingomonas sp.]MBO9711721.1 SGNH/GDSL hydrolase family protein [Sphingomonas sp.]